MADPTGPDGGTQSAPHAQSGWYGSGEYATLAPMKTQTRPPRGLRLHAFSWACAAIVLAPSVLDAQPTCILPVSAYVTDEAGTPLDGATDLELRFYVDADPGSAAVECRTLADVGVEEGWLRLLVDACSAPDPTDCGAAPLTELMIGADALWVGLRIGDAETELSPRLPVGAAPYAIRAADSDTLDGLNADEFERSGAVEAHAADAGHHHSPTSDGIDITPSSVQVGDSILMDGTIDLGPDADDVLTAEMVRTLTSGGEADSLHLHAGGAGDTGGCYQSWGATTCGEGYTVMYTGVAGVPYLWENSGSGTGDVLCVESAAISGYTFGVPGFDGMGITTVRDGPERMLIAGDRLACAVCCQ